MPDILKRIRTVLKSLAVPFRGTAAYWERRYRRGRTSGTGSYGEQAQLKAGFVNDFVAEHNISTVIDFGCGDGNQLLHADYPAYVGFDISKTAVAKCAGLFAGDASKSFKRMDDYHGDYAQLTISLEVIFHLVESDTFSRYMHRLFDSAISYVIICSPDSDSNKWGQPRHIKLRKFSAWIAKNKPTWDLYRQTKRGRHEFYAYKHKTAPRQPSHW